MPDDDFERLVKGAHVSISPMTATSRGSSVSKTISSRASSRSSTLGGSAGGVSGAGSAGAASPGEAGVAGSVVAGSLMAVSPKGGCGKLYACLTGSCRRCLRCGRCGFSQLCSHGVHPGVKIACQDRVDLADRVAHDRTEKGRGRGVPEVDVSQQRGEGQQEKTARLNEGDGMRDQVLARGAALERGLRLERVDRRRDVGELAVPLERLQASLKGGWLLAHFNGCAWRAISMQRSAKFPIIVLRCAICALRNHMTSARKMTLISTSSRKAGGSVEISLSLILATSPTMPCRSSLVIALCRHRHGGRDAGMLLERGDA